MKKRFFGLLLFAFAILVPNYKVNADQAFSLSCNPKAANDETIKCELRYEAASDKKIDSIKGEITLSSNFKLDRIDSNSGFNNESINKENLNFEYLSTTGVSTNEVLLTIYLKTNIVDNTKTYDQVNVLIKTVDGTITKETKVINVPSNNIQLETKNEKRLSIIKVNTTDGTLIPNFESNVFEYSLTTAEEEVKITAEPVDEKAKVSIKKGTNGKVKLEYGITEVEIVVTAQDGTEQTYKLVITRNDSRNDNTKLQLLSVDGKKVALKDNVYDYEIDVPYETTQANLLYAASSSTSTVEVKGSEELNVGKNEIVVMVTSEKGNVEKYYLTITRLKEIKSDDSSIKKLEITNVNNLDLDFNSKTHNYTITLPKKVKELKFNIELNDEKARYNITGNEDLKNYSKVLIKVTAEDESTTTYTFLIEKKESSNLMLILIILIIILIAILVGIIVLIKKNNKNNKKDKSNKEKKDLIEKEDNNKKKDDNVVVFTDPGDSVISSEEIKLPEEETKEENIIVFTDPEEDKSILTDTKEFVINRPKETVNEPFENPEFEENKIELENPMFNEKDISDGENPNFE